MRQLVVMVARDSGERVLRSARDCGASVIGVTPGRDEAGGEVDIVLLYLPNARVGPFLERVDAVPDLRISWLPVGALTLTPPSSEAAEQVVDVTPRSAFEVFLSGLQAIGSWRGFLSYAVIAGIVVWLGLYTNTVYLLVAAMLIAPFAGPAMNAAIATARGDLSLLGHAVARYVAGLAVTIATAALLSLLFRQESATSQMASVANLSAAAVLLPLAAGAAGALQLSQSERSSLVPGAAIGMLVAASLAPPAGIVGMGAVIGEWEMVLSGLFLLGLQLAGINLTGSAVFRLFGLRPRGPRYARGRPAITVVSLTVTLVGLLALLAVQFGTPAPQLQRSSLEQQLRETALSVVRADPEAGAAEVTAEFTRAEIPGQRTLLIRAYVQPLGNAVPPEQLSERLTAGIQEAVRREAPDVTPLVQVTVLRPPAGGGRAGEEGARALWLGVRWESRAVRAAPDWS